MILPLPAESLYWIDSDRLAVCGLPPRDPNDDDDEDEENEDDENEDEDQEPPVVREPERED
jgi:hypothetical protein